MTSRWWLLASGLLVASVASAESRVAVMPIDTLTISPAPPRATITALEEAIQDSLANALPAGRWSMVPANESLRVMAEAGVDPRSCTDPACQLPVARELKVARFLHFTLYGAGGEYRLETDVIDAREGRRIAEDQVTASLPKLPAAFDGRLETLLQRAGFLQLQETVKPVEPPKPKVRKNRVEPKSGLDLAWFAGGTLRQGCEPKDEECLADEKETKEVTVAPFWIMKLEVSAKAYEHCIRVGVCSGAANSTTSAERCNWNRRPDYPINCVTYEQARQFCRWLGGDLPTADEWEFAAKDGGGRIYPWGNDPPSPELAQMSLQDTAPVSSHPKGASPAGVLNLIGNVAEWTRTPSDIPGRMQVRGGAYDSGERWLRASARGSGQTDQGDDSIGFRCRFDGGK